MAQDGNPVCVAGSQRYILPGMKCYEAKVTFLRLRVTASGGHISLVIDYFWIVLKLAIKIVFHADREAGKSMNIMHEMSCMILHHLRAGVKSVNCKGELCRDSYCPCCKQLLLQSIRRYTYSSSLHHTLLDLRIFGG